MKLQADPTVVYTIKKRDGFDTKIRRVLYKDLRIKSPYNTYVNRGLPPGPIFTPDISAIEAVLNRWAIPLFILLQMFLTLDIIYFQELMLNITRKKKTIHQVVERKKH